ncbi:prephenate dehydratase [Rhodococcus sp. NPDC003322]
MPRIAYFGPSGTFTEMALDQFESSGAFDGPVERVSVGSPPAALAAVQDGSADAAVVPIESSVEGPVRPTLDALAAGERLQIIAETELDVAFTIVGRAGTTLADVRTIRAYPVAEAQVRMWIEANLPDAVVESASSNAGAAEDVAAGRADAGVSTALAGQRLGLDVLADGVADFSGARTRFVLITRPCPVPAATGSDRTSVVLQLNHEPGSLVGAMAEFSTRGIDLTRIESRPTRVEFGTYLFYLDCSGHVDDTAVAEALKSLHRKHTVRFLGSWPTATPGGRRPPSDGEAGEWLARIRGGETEGTN